MRKGTREVIGRIGSMCPQLAVILRRYRPSSTFHQAAFGFIIRYLAMGLALKFACPMIARWLAGSHPGWRTILGGYVEKAPT